MQISTATILHARTCNVDFRANLLAVPEDFSQEDIQLARKQIVSSTRYFELVGTSGRRLVFGNKTHVISGISIRIGDLYRLCGQEPQYEFVDGKRINYAFIGLVFPKCDLQAAVDIPYSTFLAEFEKYMLLRWEDANDSAALMHTKTDYCTRELPVSQKVSTLLQASDRTIPQVIDSKADSAESIAAQATLLAAQQDHFAFCSDIPTANCVRESNFNAVTSTNAASILASMQKSNTKVTTGDSASIPTQKNSPKQLCMEATQEKKKDQSIKSRTTVPFLVVAGIILLALVVWILAK